MFGGFSYLCNRKRALCRRVHAFLLNKARGAAHGQPPIGHWSDNHTIHTLSSAPHPSPAQPLGGKVMKPDGRFWFGGGKTGGRTKKAEDGRSRIPPTLQVSFNIRASCRIRTNDPEITNHVLWPTELKRRVGKLLTSRRYNQLPLLRSRPGGFEGSWPCKTCPS